MRWALTRPISASPDRLRFGVQQLQSNEDGAPLAGDALDSDLAVLQLDQPAGDEEDEPSLLHLIALDLVRAVEEMVHLVRRYPHPLISHGHLHT